MRKLIWGAVLALVAGCASTGQTGGAATERPDGQRLARMSAEVLFWSQEQRNANFRRMHDIFPVNRIAAGGTPRPLREGASIEAAIGSGAIDEFIAAQNVAGLIVLQDGRVRLERYALGFSADQRWTSFSVAKSLTSTLIGAAVRDGHIRSLDDAVTRYVPELAGSAYDGVTIRQVLTMSSGVRWNEDYADPNSDIARIFATEPPPGEDMTLAYLRRLPREAEPGTRFHYNTAETNLAGIILMRAIRRPLALYASEKIWRPYGMEADAFWQVDHRGNEVAGCCLSARLRDYARIGQFMLDGGRAGGRNLLPAGWIAEATRMQHSFPGGQSGYGYQWWTSAQGYSASGIFGQTIWIDPSRRLVIAAFSAAPQATSRDYSQARIAFFRRIVAAVDAAPAS